MKIKTLLQSLLAVASLVQVEANAMEGLTEAKKGQLNNYCVYLASQYFETEDDFANVEIGCKRFRGNTSKYFYNPIALNKTTREWFNYLRTLYIYTANDETFDGDEKIEERKLTVGPLDLIELEYLHKKYEYKYKEHPFIVTLTTEYLRTLSKRRLSYLASLLYDIGFLDVAQNGAHYLTIPPVKLYIPNGVLDSRMWSEPSSKPEADMIFFTGDVYVERGALSSYRGNAIEIRGILKIRVGEGADNLATFEDFTIDHLVTLVLDIRNKSVEDNSYKGPDEIHIGHGNPLI